MKTPGRCVQADDMTNELFPKFIDADIAVLASPLYYFNMNACLKSFVDRTLPMFEPQFKDLGAQTGHPLRYGRIPKIVTMSVCAFPDPDIFQALSLTWKMIFGPYLCAEIYRHSSEFFDIPDLAAKVRQVLAAVTQAGKEMVQIGKVALATTHEISQELAPRARLIDWVNQYWRETLPVKE
jgi:hypothetical protein